MQCLNRSILSIRTRRRGVTITVMREHCIVSRAIMFDCKDDMTLWASSPPTVSASAPSRRKGLAEQIRTGQQVLGQGPPIPFQRTTCQIRGFGNTYLETVRGCNCCSEVSGLARAVSMAAPAADMIYPVVVQRG